MRRSPAQYWKHACEHRRRPEAALHGNGVLGRKQHALDAISQQGFWDDDGRFAVLAEVEYLDRFEAALRTARKLADRLRRQRRRNGHGSSELVALLASRVYVLERALVGLDERAPFDVFLRLRPVGHGDADEAAAFAQTLAAMYLAWAERRGMRVERLEAKAPEHLLAISGLGAATILAAEGGLHLLEVVTAVDDGGADVDRVGVAVQLAPWLPGPDAASAQAAAADAFAAAPTATQVVRRYRMGPAPLVRDSVRGYRTGRLDRVLAGDFDMF